MHDHGGGVRSLRVPIPDNPLGHTLVYVVDTDRGPVLIDTGWDDPESWDTLADGLTACGTSVAEIHGVVITHHHPDHHGLSGRVREASGAWIAMHAADTAVVRRTRQARPERWFSYMTAKLTAAGAPEEHIAPLRTPRPRALPGLSPALPDRDIVPGELLDLAGRRLRAIWTPGHTPGHVCLHLEETHPTRLPGHGRLFSGDHLLPGITPHIGLYEDPDDATVTDPLGDYLDSLERVGRLAPAEVLPAHQHPFPTPPPVCASCSPTTRPASPPCGPSSPSRSRPGSSPNAWSGTAPGSRSRTAPGTSRSRRPRPICAAWSSWAGRRRCRGANR
ncbi:hypothetical protein GCM10011428_84660 [Streptomyces violaceus]